MKLSFAVFLSLYGALPGFGNGDGGSFLPFLTQPSAETTPSPAVPPRPLARQLSGVHDASPTVAQSPNPGILKRPRTDSSRGADYPPSAPSSPVAAPIPTGSSPALPPLPKRVAASASPEIPLGQPSQEAFEELPLERSDRVPEPETPEGKLRATIARFLASADEKKMQQAVDALHRILPSILLKAAGSFGDEHGW